MLANGRTPAEAQVRLLNPLGDTASDAASSRVTPGDGASDSGNAAIGAVAFGMLALLAISNVVGGIVMEHRAVEDDLTQTRLYWAAMGHASYLLSRTRQVGACVSSCDKEGDMARESSKLLAEISGLQVWQYPELGSAYRFKLSPTLVDDLHTYEKGNQGDLRFSVRFEAADDPAAKDLQALRTVPTTRSVVLRYCLSKLSNELCGGEDDKDATVSWIVSVHRPAAVRP